MAVHVNGMPADTQHSVRVGGGSFSSAFNNSFISVLERVLIAYALIRDGGER